MKTMRAALFTMGLAGTLALGGQGAPAQEDAAPPAAASAQGPAQELERIEVTGSYIKRAEAATVENIQVVTAQEIKASGQETVADYLRTLSTSFGNNSNESFSNSFAPGAAMIGLRGLSQKDTLVLLNGRRMTNYAFFQNLSDSFVDLNIIPLAAIDRIEILKSGGSAIYGSDAIAGVVNIILKQNSTEKTVEAGGRITTDGGGATRDADVLLGFGDFASQGYNLTTSASVYKRDQLLFSQRENTASQNYVGQPDGILGYHISNQYGTSTPVPFPNCGSAAQPGFVTNGYLGPGCYYNAANQLPLMPGGKRANLTLTGNLRLDENWTAFVDAFYVNGETISNYTPARLDQFSFAVNPVTGGATAVSNVLPASNPYALGGAATPITYTFQSVGPRNYETVSNTYRVSGGVKGTWQGWDLDAAYGHSESHASFTQQNGINAPILSADIANGTFDFLDPSQTPGANAALGIDFGFASIAKLDTLGAKASGGLFELPGGKSNIAVGLEFRHESVNDQPGAAIAEGLVMNEGATKVVAGRSIYSVFAELDLPVLKSLDADLAVREEHYNDIGNNFRPQLTLRWQPVRELTVRAVEADGFRAPSLAEASNSTSLAHQSILAPGTGAPETVGYITGGNPKVKPETSKNFDLGVVISPVNNFNLSLDYFSIYLYNVIAPNASAQQIVADPSAYPGEISYGPGGNVLSVTALYTNQFEIHTSGVDINSDLTVPLPGGARFKLAFDATYLAHFMVSSFGQWSEFVGSNGWDYISPISGGGPVPRWKGSITGAWSNQDWTGAVTLRYTDSYANSLTTYGFGTTQKEVDSFESIDLNGQYRGLKNWKFSVSIVNLLNREPPYDSAALLSGTYAPPTSAPYDVFTYDDLGRMIDVHAAYTF
jgi:iron complex outermembrane receptor protein